MRIFGFKSCGFSVGQEEVTCLPVSSPGWSTLADFYQKETYSWSLNFVWSFLHRLSKVYINVSLNHLPKKLPHKKKGLELQFFFGGGCLLFCESILNGSIFFYIHSVFEKSFVIKIYLLNSIMCVEFYVFLLVYIFTFLLFFYFIVMLFFPYVNLFLVF